LLFKHLVDSSPHGEQLLFASRGRIGEQDEAVLRFNLRSKNCSGERPRVTPAGFLASTKERSQVVRRYPRSSLDLASSHIRRLKGCLFICQSFLVVIGCLTLRPSYRNPLRLAVRQDDWCRRGRLREICDLYFPIIRISLRSREMLNARRLRTALSATHRDVRFPQFVNRRQRCVGVAFWKILESDATSITPILDKTQHRHPID
jgi:hypothetical protein